MGLFLPSRQNKFARPDQRRLWWASLFFLCAILGALLGLSFKAQNVLHSENLPARNYPALAQEYIMLKRRGDDQERTIAKLQQNLSQLENSTTSHTQQSKALVDDLKQIRFAAGLTAVTGPGLVVTLNDSKKPFPGMMPAGIAPPNIIHDTDINQIVNELKAAGTEAIAVNDQRLTAMTPIRCAGPTIYVNNTPQTPPYVIRAIGNPKDLLTALNMSGGLADQMKQFDPAMMRTEKTAHLTLPAYAGPTQPKYARPVAASGSESAKG